MFIARIVVNRLNGNQQDLFLPITEFVSLIGEAEKQRQKEQERDQVIPLVHFPDAHDQG